MVTNSSQSRETGIHDVYPRGISVSVSRERGALLLITTSASNGRRITIKGMDSHNRDVTAYFSVGEYRRNGKTVYAGVSSRLVPGNYYASGGGHGYEEFSIDSGRVAQMTWTY